MNVQNNQVGDILRDTVKIDILQMPSVAIAPSVVPVLDVTPKNYLQIKTVQAGSASSNAAGTVLTCSASRKTHVVGVQYSYIKDAACDVSTGSAEVRCTVNSVLTRLTSVYLLTSTAQNASFYVPLGEVIPDKGSSVVFAQGTFTLGTFARSAIIYYYETD